MSYTPSKRFFIALLVLTFISLGSFLWSQTNLIWLLLLIILSLAIITDLLWLSRCQIFIVKEHFSHQPTVQKPFNFALYLDISSVPINTALSIESIQSDLLIPTKSEAVIEKRNSDEIVATWELLPKKRGELFWPGAYARCKTPLGLIISRQHLTPLYVSVYPCLIKNIFQILNPALLMEQVGIKTNRFLKADHEFESLRPYVLGDNYRHIDWKASARSQTLISRQFQLEHHHNILVCLDNSRIMGTITEGISKLDWAIEATLHLAYLAAKFQDRIGLLIFSDHVERWIKPVISPMETFLSTMYNLESHIVESDLSKVCLSIMAAQKKRSLVIFLSDFMDASSLEPSMAHLQKLGQRHCTLFVGIEDPAYKRYLQDETCETALGIAHKIVSQDSMCRRNMVLQHLKKMGLKTLSVNPQNLVQEAMNAYMEIKFQGAI